MSLPDLAYDWAILRERGWRGLLAWKMIQWCSRLYPSAFFYQRLWVSQENEQDTPLVEWIIYSDLYGGGMSAELRHNINGLEIHEQDFNEEEFDKFLEEEFLKSNGVEVDDVT